MTFDAAGSAAPGITDIKAYVPGRTIAEVARDLGIDDIIKLASNENPLGSSPKAVAAIAASLERSHQYPEVINPVVQQALGAANGVPPECVVTGNGGDSVLLTAALAFLRPGDEVLVPQITFDMYRIAALTKGATVVEVPMPGLELTADAILDRISERTRMVFVCNPNNPTGLLFPRDAIRRLLAELPERVILVHDEVYREFADQEAFPELRPRAAAGPGNLILVRSMAKAYGLAGVRFGYGIMAADTAALLHRVRPPFDTSVPAQAAALGALEDEQFLRRTLDLNRRGKRQLYAAFEQLGLAALPSHANFILVDVGQPAAAVAQRLLEQGVIVRTPGHPALAQYLRVSIGTTRELQRFIDTLTDILSAPASGEEAPRPGAVR
jgi:histidinol-phosphate aminotransferase